MSMKKPLHKHGEQTTDVCFADVKASLMEYYDGVKCSVIWAPS